MNIGSMTSWIRSKSFHVLIHVTAAIPAPAKPKPMTKQAGNVSRAHGDSINPSAAMTTRNAAEYSIARTTAHSVSPTATSFGLTGVERIDSYTFDSRSFQNTFVAS